MPFLTKPILDLEALAALGNARILDARSGPAGRAAYEVGHLPGAIHADLDADLAGAVEDAAIGGRHPLPPLDAWARTLGRWGIDPVRPVVVYDDQQGANAAARVWWMLRAVGHEDVAILDGGLHAVVAAGATIETAEPTVDDVGPYPVEAWQLPVVDRAFVALHRDDPSWLILDVRAPERFRGEAEPIDPVAGHIPGAVNVPYVTNLVPDGKFKSPDELHCMYVDVLGSRDPSQLIVHCGSGVTACHTLAALAHAGLYGASLYVGSWSEWCRTDEPRVP
jgi:thiosulfate/3-mercaptopyruvate sulfurtransferase